MWFDDFQAANVGGERAPVCDREFCVRQVVGQFVAVAPAFHGRNQVAIGDAFLHNFEGLMKRMNMVRKSRKVLGRFRCSNVFIVDIVTDAGCWSSNAAPGQTGAT